ncbi:MAG: hypothetical protein Q7S56_01255 [Nanoarchaeota archaeon]|nr:hypothetical protein [Nanoarchaeota archaeon]
MKRGIIILLLLSILLISPLIQAQTYSGFNRFSDNVKLFFSNGDNKVKLALEIREKEVNSALENIENGNTENVVKNLDKARDKLKIVQEKISLNNSEEVKKSVEKIKEKINKENLSEEFKEYKLEEEKTQLTAELTLKTFEYCKALAQEDYSLMLKEEKCNPETATPGLEKELKELKNIQEKSFVQLMLNIRSCIDDPGTCNCEENTDIAQKAKCEKLVALAIKCEYKDDETACDELESIKPKKGDSFAESFVPDFLKNLFKEKDYMIGYGINHSCGVPEECWDENDKPECKQYDYLKETKDDWDEYGNYIGTKKECGTKGPIPTMQESIPQCFEGDKFLEEKCGKITMVENEDGLINYIIGKEIDNIIEEFENKSEQHTIDVNGTKGQTMINEIKEEINQINKQIVNITYAAGTGPGGESGVVIEGDEEGVKTGDNNGDDGLKPEVKTSTSGDGTNENEVVEDGNKNEVNYDPSITNAPGDTIDDPDGEPTETINP